MSKLKNRNKRKLRKQKQQSRMAHVSSTGGLFVIETILRQAATQQSLNVDAQTEINLHARIALNTLLSGEPTQDDWIDVNAAMHVARTLAKNGIGSEYEDLFNRALAALNTCQECAKRNGFWRFRGPDIETMRDAMFIHELQVNRVTAEQIKQAYDEYAEYVMKITQPDHIEMKAA
jgi:hypothetical protein